MLFSIENYSIFQICIIIIIIYLIIHLFVDKKLQQKIIIHFIPTIVDKTLNTIQKVYGDRIEELYKN